MIATCCCAAGIAIAQSNPGNPVSNPSARLAARISWKSFVSKLEPTDSNDLQPNLGIEFPPPPSLDRFCTLEYEDESSKADDAINEIGLSALTLALQDADDAPSSDKSGAMISPDSQTSENWHQPLATPILVTKPEESVTVSLDQLILATLQCSKRVEVARIESFIEHEKVVQRDAQFDVNAFTRSLFTSTNIPTSTTLQAGVGQARLIQTDQNSQAGIRKKNRIGGTWEANQEFRLLSSNSVFLNPDQQALTQMILRYNQPLLRDGGELVNEGQVVLARIGANAVSAESEAAMVAILEELVQGYWEVFRLRGRYAVQLKFVRQISDLLSDIRKRSRIDARPSLLGQAEASLATQTAVLATTRTELIQAQLQLIRTVGDRQLANYREIIPISQVPEFSIPVDKEAALSVALTARPEMRAAAQRIRGSELLRDIAENQLMPSLALLMETTVSGLAGDYDIARSFGDQFSRGGPGFVAGVTYDFPWGNRAAKSELRAARMALARDVATLEDTVDQVRFEVEGTIAGLQGAAEQYQIRVQSAKKSDAVVVSLIRRRELFPGELDQVSQLYVSEILDAMQRRAVAELEIIDLMAQYAITTIQLRKAMGTLLDQQPLSPCDSLPCVSLSTVTSGHDHP